MLITNVSSQDEYYGDQTYRFSDRLQEGVEISWIFLQYSVVTPAITDSGPTTQTYYETYTSTDENGEEIESTTEYVYVEDSDYYDYPDIPENTIYMVKILKDLENMTENEFYDLYEEYDDYFETSVSNGNESEILNFITPGVVFNPSVIEFENGTKVNALQYQYEQELKWQEEYSETYTTIVEGEESSSEISLVDGVYTQKAYFKFENETNRFEVRTHVDTGVVLYIYSSSEGPDYKLVVELEVYETVGINLSDSGPNEELSLPLSPFFAYALLIMPIVISKIRKR